MHRNDLLNMLTHYHSRFMEEEAYVRRAIDFIHQHESIFDRETPIHITGSAWVVSPDCEQVLLMHHRKLNQWFQPGGHADGEPDILRVVKDLLEGDNYTVATAKNAAEAFKRIRARF